MCLYNTDFACFYDRKLKQYVGYGFKSLFSSDISEYKLWTEAKGWNNNIKSNVTRVSGEQSRNKHYHPGFHIFLDVKDAKGYRGPYSAAKLYLVKFHTVIGYGKQSLFDVNKLAPCVIARYMRIVKEVKDDFDMSVLWKQTGPSI